MEGRENQGSDAYGIATMSDGGEEGWRGGAEAEAKRYLEEESLLERAEEVLENRKARHRQNRPLPRGPEPTREKCHWDYVLEEMQWLAKDVAKERKWKAAQARKWSKVIVRSNLDIESKKRKRIKEAELERRRTASGIAKQISRFWGQVEKLVLYKHQMFFEQKKKEALDAHLNVLLGQTEQMTKRVAENLHLKSGSYTIATDHDGSKQPLLNGTKSYETAEGDAEEEYDADFVARDSDDEADDLSTLEEEEILEAEEGDVEKRRIEELRLLREEMETPMEEILAMHQRMSLENQSNKCLLQEGLPIKGDSSDVSPSEDDDYTTGSSEDVDEMDTLLEEEERAEAEGCKEEREAMELAALKNEQNVPVEDLLKLYNVALEQTDSRPDVWIAAEDVADSDFLPSEDVSDDLDTFEEEEQLEQEEGNKLQRRAEELEQLLMDQKQPVEFALDHYKNATEAVPHKLDPVGAEGAMGAMKLPLTASSSCPQQTSIKHIHENEERDAGAVGTTSTGAATDDVENQEDGSYIISSYSEDDEATLEEEERLAYTEQGPSAKEEIHNLEDEAQMSIEEILERYRRNLAPPQIKCEAKDESLQSQRHKGDAYREFPTKKTAVVKEYQEDAGTNGHGVDIPPPTLKHYFDTGDFSNGEDSDYLSPSDEADIESTIEEEEELAQKEGLHNPQDEIHALKSEASIPIAVLYEHYRDLQESEADVPANHGSELVHDEEMKQYDSEEELFLDSEGSLSSKDYGMEYLRGIMSAPGQESEKDGHKKDHAEDYEQETQRLIHAMETVGGAQPTGHTLSTTQVKTQVPFLLKYPLREYQHIGLDWLVSLNEKKLNGILADEMGLGKTIQTIALLAHLAVKKGIWGPHLIVVPTSVMLNWEMELYRFCPAFKVLTYFGTAKERKVKRQGWSKANSFHVCITTYTLILKDIKILGRKKWHYLILDEAHMIKNWRSQRWQALLNFNAKRRLLLTGTPLQNDLMELWALLHFLMPHVFSSHQQFRDWFSSPLTGMVEGQSSVNTQLVKRLHGVLRPFLLRRVKRDVEKSLPPKEEHILYCRLSKRQRELYEDYMSSGSTQETLNSGNLLGIMNCLMQLRKVCNHPDLFESRPIVSAYDMEHIEIRLPSLVFNIFEPSLCHGKGCVVQTSGFHLVNLERMAKWELEETELLASMIKEEKDGMLLAADASPPYNAQNLLDELARFYEGKVCLSKVRAQNYCIQLSQARSRYRPIYGRDLVAALLIPTIFDVVLGSTTHPKNILDCPSSLLGMVASFKERAMGMEDTIKECCFVIPRARTRSPVIWCSKTHQKMQDNEQTQNQMLLSEVGPLLVPLQKALVHQKLFFPDRRLIQFDCGKLQILASLLRRLKMEGHRCLIFTQMSKMLDVLESFLNLYGYTYLRLDGTTKPEQRQILMQKYNGNPRIFCFILSTRSGGLGMNLTGADSVIFYDSDWNPAMDAQAQDRAHRIGQTRVVHIYRLVSYGTIEENILLKSRQKQELDFLAIQSGDFNTEFFKKSNLIDILGAKHASSALDTEPYEDVKEALKHVEDEADVAAAEAAEREHQQELAEFSDAPPAEEENEETGEVSKPSDKECVPSGKVEEPLMEDAGFLEEKVERAVAIGASWEKELLPIERYAIRFYEEHYAPQRIITAEMALAHEEKVWERQALESARMEIREASDEDELHSEDNHAQEIALDPSQAAIAYRNHLARFEGSEAVDNSGMIPDAVPIRREGKLRARRASQIQQQEKNKRVSR